MHVEPDVTDAARVARVIAGDHEAFADLYRQYRPDVYRFAAHMTGSAVVAEDLTQDVFLTVIREIGRYDPARGALLGWLLGITRNHVRRWQHRRRWQTLAGLDDTRLGVVSSDPLADLDRAREEAALKRALCALPIRYREVIVLCDLQEVSYDAAAHALNCPVGTIRSRLHRGRSRLSRALGLEAQAPARRASVARVL